ncbi:MAG: hypothetical protein KatS3mg042_1318 [Rhodothermaceae bacterium]|nr:MAG: hypothetical protein KatS3mg042_1318 [Rhodothermaceae bacterium]
MRKALSIGCLLLMLGLAWPAQAQLREAAHELKAPARLYDQAGFSLNKFFSPAHFRMSHSFEFSAGSFGGQANSLAMYTNTMAWQFSSKLAARVDVAFAFSPFSGTDLEGLHTGNQGRVFLRNAELAWRPAENVMLNISVRQSPYGLYASPYGYYNPYGNLYGVRHNAADLFWNDNLR